MGRWLIAYEGRRPCGRRARAGPGRREPATPARWSRLRISCSNPIPGLLSLASTGPVDEPDRAFVVGRKEWSVFPFSAPVEPS